MNVNTKKLAIVTQSFKDDFKECGLLLYKIKDFISIFHFTAENANFAL